MNKLLLVLALCYTAVSFAQVGIGTEDPDTSAQLDVVATDKGILIPRLNIKDLKTADPVSAADIAVSLLVYNTNIDSGPGYYFWDGEKWSPLGGIDLNIFTSSGAPTATNPADAKGGDLYVDKDTGDIYTYNATTNEWESQSEIVSGEDGNLIEKDDDGLAFLDAAGLGVPTATNPADPSAGDLYVDEDTGDIYTYNATTNE